MFLYERGQQRRAKTRGEERDTRDEDARGRQRERSTGQATSGGGPMRRKAQRAHPAAEVMAA